MILEQVRQEVRKNQLASAGKEVKTITWDGDTTGKVVIPDFATNRDDSSFVRVYDKFSAITKESIKRIVIDMNGVQQELPKSMYTVVEQEGLLFISDTGASIVFAILVPAGFEEIGFVEGIYFFSGFMYTGWGTDEVAIVEIELELETIHPIPQEYIPPLDRLILNGADGNQYALTITDGALSVAPVTT